MAIKIYEQFKPFANPADGDHPYGSFKNDSIPGAEDGTPLDAVWANDYAGFDAELFAQAGIVPNGQPDKLGASQRVDALKKIHGAYVTVSSLSTGDYPIGAHVIVTDQGNAPRKVVSGSGANGTTILDAGAGKVAILDFDGTLFIEWVGAKGDWNGSTGTDNRQYIQAAFDYFGNSGSGSVSAFSGRFAFNGTLNRPRGVDFKAGSGIEFVANYSGMWIGLGLVSVPENAAIYVKDNNGFSDRGLGYESEIDITLTSFGASAVEGIAYYLGTPNKSSVTGGSTIGNAVRGLTINGSVANFDTGLYVSEAWSCKFGLDIGAVRVHCRVQGQSVNNNWHMCQWGGGTNAYTSSTQESVGVIIKGDNYGAGLSTLKRPEGLTWSQCLIAENDLAISAANGLFVTFDDCIIDLHRRAVLETVTSPGLKLTNSYLASAGTLYALDFVNASSSPDLDDIVENCTIVNLGETGTQKALYATGRLGLRVRNNMFRGFTADNVIEMTNILDVDILDNKFQLMDSATYADNACINISNSTGVTIDGNKSTSNAKILKISGTNNDMTIGKNRSVTQQTNALGEVTLLAGQTSVAINLTHNNTSIGAPGNTGLRSIVTAIPSAQVGSVSVATDGANSNQAVVTVSSAPPSNTQIKYVMQCVV